MKTNNTTTKNTVLVIYQCSGCNFEAGKRTFVKRHIEQKHKTISPIIGRSEVNMFDKWERDKYE